MEVCPEMKKFRDNLDELGIEWKDESDELICQTKFKLRRKKWSVINGHGTYGGVNNRTKENDGLLEIWDGTKKNDPKGWLKAEEAIVMTCGTHLK